MLQTPGSARYISYLTMLQLLSHYHMAHTDLHIHLLSTVQKISFSRMDVAELVGYFLKTSLIEILAAEEQQGPGWHMV